MPYIEKQCKEQQSRWLKQLFVIVNKGIHFLQKQEVAYYLIELLESKAYLMQKLSEHLFGDGANKKQMVWDALQRQPLLWDC